MLSGKMVVSVIGFCAGALGCGFPVACYTFGANSAASLQQQHFYPPYKNPCRYLTVSGGDCIYVRTKSKKSRLISKCP